MKQNEIVEENWVTKFGNEIISKVIQELKRENNMKSFETAILKPLLQRTFYYLYPYIIITSIVFFLTFIFACAILVIIIRGQIVSNL